MNLITIRLTMYQKAELIEALPSSPFSVKDLKKKLSKGFQGKELGQVLRALEYRGVVCRAGTTGRQNRFVLWKKVEK